MTNLQTLSAYLQECRWCSFKKSIKNGQVYDIKLDMLPYDNNNKLFILGQAKLLDGTIVVPSSQAEFEAAYGDIYELD